MSTDLEEYGGRWGFLREVWTRFEADNLGLYAAAISFYALLSVVPLLLVGVAVLGFVVTPESARNLVLDFSAQFLPGRNAARVLADRIGMEEAVAGIVASRGVAALVGFGSLLWTSSHVFYHLQTAMNVAWRARRPRHILKARALSLGMVVGAGGLFLLSLTFTAALRAVRDLRIRLPFLAREIAPDTLPLVWESAGFLTTLLLSVLTFVVLLRFLPATRVPWRPALVAGAGVGVIWESAKQVFAFYLARIVDFNKIYGALGGLIGLVLWVNISVLLLLIGAEMAAVWTARDYRRKAGH